MYENIKLTDAVITSCIRISFTTVAHAYVILVTPSSDTDKTASKATVDKIHTADASQNRQHLHHLTHLEFHEKQDFRFITTT
jgi:mRNA-degrading endonuclease toxin of MazEF toxin-antitoxin module